MVDVLTAGQRRRNMRAIRGSDTRPERLVRSLLHQRGLRFRLQRRDLPGRPDLVLPRHCVAVFVHGCFWHGHGCPMFRLPATRTDFWRDKIATNKCRDAAAKAALDSLGWRQLWVWECATRGRGRLTQSALGDQMENFVRGDARMAEIVGDLTVSKGPKG